MYSEKMLSAGNIEKFKPTSRTQFYKSDQILFQECIRLTTNVKIFPGLIVDAGGL